MSRALLVISHGSRREASNTEVKTLTDKLAAFTKDRFDFIEAAFLELAEPSIPAGIKTCVDKGATQITIIPYFLAAGRHVAEDIPEIVDAARPDYTDIEITIAPHIGQSDFMAEFVANTAISSVK